MPAKSNPAPVKPESKNRRLSILYPKTTPVRISMPAAIWTCLITGNGCFLSSTTGRLAIFHALIPPVIIKAGTGPAAAMSALAF